MGRPSKQDNLTRATARMLWDSGRFTQAEIARLLGISRMTLWRMIGKGDT